MSGALEVLRADLPITIQDLGRPLAQRFGVPIGGAMDRFALVAANRLLDNPPDAAALEITGGGGSFLIREPLALAVAGADLGATLDGETLPLWTAVLARSGQELVCGVRRLAWGARAYLAIAGGVDVPLVLGARSTSLPGGFGGLQGRPLRRGDVLRAGQPSAGIERLAGRSWPPAHRPRYRAAPTLRFLPGPHADLFPAAARALLEHAEWRIGPLSNRTGYRLGGPPIALSGEVTIASHGVVPGALQVPPDGAPILLMADAQTTGGYPIVGVVCGADLALAAQLLPGDALRLAPTTAADAVAAWRALSQWQQTPFPLEPEIEALAWAGALDL